MGYIGGNIVAILAATLAGLAVGAVFRRFDSSGSGRLGVVAIAVICLAEFWLAAILAGALILAPNTQAGAWTMAIGSAVVIWIGFVLPALVVSDLHRGLPPSAIVVDCLHWLVAMAIQAIVLHVIGLTHP